ncbi:hypothetical protein Tcan_06859 [Toxocara canis]|uniref:Uncharacterized protein n=1 Tax=Toxocara canis TaxID=6265 RepID=A0A0B2VTQ5_TOXCA|nr:hypothetical protein Tcan_06859 [Toxocara canis]
MSQRAIVSYNNAVSGWLGEAALNSASGGCFQKRDDCGDSVKITRTQRAEGTGENVDIHHVEAQESAWGICKKLYRFHVDYDPGVVLLISGASTAYRPVLAKLVRCGWRVQLIHPENTPKELTERADESCSLEAILGCGIGENNAMVDFPNTAYFGLSELGRTDLAIEMLNNVAEQYESKVIYFNERAGEAVIELRAFDIESGISLLTARLRARSPASGVVLETTPYRFEPLPSVNFLGNINIAKLICERDSKKKRMAEKESYGECSDVRKEISSVHVTAKSDLVVDVSSFWGFCRRYLKTTLCPHAAQLPLPSVSRAVRTTPKRLAKLGTYRKHKHSSIVDGRTQNALVLLICSYYPNCSSTADECGFAHPFCADFCHCPKGKRDPQKNHRILDDRCFGGGDRVKYGGGSGTQ